MTTIRSKFEILKKKYTTDLAVKNNINKTINEYNMMIFDLEEKINLCDKASMVLTSASLNAKKSVTAFLEEVVTDALQYISNGDYSFKIIIDDSGKTTKCEFFIEEKVGEEASLQKPEDSCGGGFVDIISTTLRYAYLNLYNNPRLCGPIILDEPGKMISSDMSIKFGEFIKKLGDEFDRQTIMITHNDNITAIADKVEVIVKN